MSEWLSTTEVAELLEVSERTVQRSLATTEDANRNWGEDGWREKPLSLRRIPQVRRSAAEAAAARGGAWKPAGDASGPAPDEQDQTGE